MKRSFSEWSMIVAGVSHTWSAGSYRKCRMNPVLHTRRSNVLTASSGVDGLNRLIPANPEQYPFARPLATMRRVLFTIVLFCVVLVGTEGQTFAQTSPNKATIVSTLPAASVFTNVYGIYGTNFITIAPWTSQGIFYQGDPVTISNSIRTTIEVYDFHSNHVTNHAPPVTLTNLPMGHYFVQVDGTHGGFGDRSQFSIWPKGYTNYLHSDIGLEFQPVWLYQPGVFNVWSNRFQRISPGFSRNQISWLIYPPDMYSGGVVTPTGTDDWVILNAWINNFSNTPNKVLNFNIYHPDNLIYGGVLQTISNSTAPLVDLTNSVSSWVSDVAVLFSNVAVQFGTNLIYEILNEPGSDYVFTNSPPYPDSTNGDSCVHPAGLAVSAAVQAIKSACPNCETWGPAGASPIGFNMELVTNTYVWSDYSNVTKISFHGGGNSVVGPPDAAGFYTNRMDLGPWMADDVGAEYINNIYGKQWATTESYPYSPDALGLTNSWWIPDTNNPGIGPGWCSTCVPNWSCSWYTMNMRWWKNLLLWEGTGVTRIEMYEGASDAISSPANWTTNSYWGDPSSYVGWGGQPANDWTGCGPRPSVDGLAMISWWLHGATPITNWLSGNQIVYVDPLGGYTNGPPGLHFWEWQFGNGTTNTFVWADEQTTITTNLGVGLTDIYSNSWRQPIGEEPLIAWNWPTPHASFTASPTAGAAPLFVRFTDTSLFASITNRFWNFGDGNTTNLVSIWVSHTYASTGTFTVTEIVRAFPLMM